jgi:hypothetical protein
VPFPAPDGPSIAMIKRRDVMTFLLLSTAPIS